MRFLLLLALCLPAWLPAKAVRKAPAPAPAATVQPTPSPAPTPAPSLRVRLKDGQVLDAKLLKYDSYFLSVVNAKGTTFDLPWAELASVEAQGIDADLALMRGHLSDDRSPVSSVIEPRRGSQALAQAFWPGLLLHGAGHRYAGDNDTFVSLAGAELFGVVVGGFGLNEVLGESKAGENKDTATALAVGGGAVFAITWLYDLAFAPGAARRFNEQKGLSLEPRLNGVQLALRF